MKFWLSPSAMEQKRLVTGRVLRSWERRLQWLCNRSDPAPPLTQKREPLQARDSARSGYDENTFFVKITNINSIFREHGHNFPWDRNHDRPMGKRSPFWTYRRSGYVGPGSLFFFRRPSETGIHTLCLLSFFAYARSYPANRMVLCSSFL